MGALARLALLLTLLAHPILAQEADPAHDHRVRVLLLGDSISMGYHQTVVEELGEDYFVVRPTNARGGFENCEGTTKGVRELDRWLALEGGNWDVIHFNFGLHDLKRVHPETRRNSNDPSHPHQAELAVYRAQLREIAERLVATGARVLFATTTPVPAGGVRPHRENADVVQFNDAARGIMRELDIPITPLYAYAGSRLEPIQRPVDVHFTPEGSAALGRIVSRKIAGIAGGLAELQKQLRAGQTWEWNRSRFVEAVVAVREHPMRRQERPYPAEYRVSQARAELRSRLRLDEVGWGVESAPPSARRLRTLPREGYSIEHWLIETTPGMHVPAHLYLPDPERFAPPYAGVLVACGHAYEGKAHPPYQIGGAAFARHGLAALVFDPLDQGERIQAPKEDASRQQHWGTTSHNITGAQARLLGLNQAGLHAWDASRCLDLLAADPRIDPERLGMCGQSGGGTQTAQLSAIDPRIKVSAPACYITSLPALAQTIGPQDEEQNLDAQIPDGLDHAEYLIARAPLPTLICAAEDDFFAISGTRESFAIAQTVFAELGRPENLQLVVSPGGHNWGRELVSATVAFMALHLDERQIEIDWSDAVPMTPEEAQVTPRGQVVWMEGERTIYQRFGELREAPPLFLPRPLPRSGDLVLGRDAARIQELVFCNPDGVRPSNLARGVSQREGASRERIALTHPDWTIALLAHDRRDENEEADPAPAWIVVGAGVSTAERPAEAPGTVHFLDVVCSGELSPTDRPWYGSFGPYGTDGAYGVLLGRPLLGRQVEQILAFAKSQPGPETLAATGLPALAAAHAYAIAPELFTAEHAIELPFASWTELFGYGSYRDALAFVVPGALTTYDLPELLAR